MVFIGSNKKEEAGAQDRKHSIEGERMKVLLGQGRGAFIVFIV